MSDAITAPSGAAPTINGDHVVALYAQLNRYRARAGQVPFVTGPVITTEAAYTAIMLMQARLVSGLIQIPDPEIVQQQEALNVALKNPIAYVQQNLDTVVQTLAVYGDTIGLPSATVGVTTNSAIGFGGPLKIALGLLGFGLLAWGLYAAWKRSQRELTADSGVNGFDGEDEAEEEPEDGGDQLTAPGGYRVAYGLVTRRNGQIVTVRKIEDAPRPLTLSEAEAWRRKLGRTANAWVETMDGQHVPVKGAKRSPHYVDDARPGDVHATLTSER